MDESHQSCFLDIDGPVHYADYGGEGAPIVLVHGLGGSHVNWAAVGPRLARHHRVVALDLRGFGRTPIGKHSATVEANAEFLFQFIRRAIGEPAIVVGASMGGLITLLETEAHPGWSLGTVLVDPAMPHPSPRAFDPYVAALFLSMATPGLGEVILWRQEQHGARRKVQEMFDLCCAEPKRVAEELVRAHVELAEELEGRRGMARAYLQATRSLVRMVLDRRRYQRIARNVRRDVLLIAGAHDRLIRLSAVKALAELRPDWRFELFPDAGHVPHMEEPERFSEVVTEWTRNLGGPGVYAPLLSGERA